MCIGKNCLAWLCKKNPVSAYMGIVQFLIGMVLLFCNKPKPFLAGLVQSSGTVQLSVDRVWWVIGAVSVGIGASLFNERGTRSPTTKTDDVLRILTYYYFFMTNLLSATTLVACHVLKTGNAFYGASLVLGIWMGFLVERIRDLAMAKAKQ